MISILDQLSQQEIINSKIIKQLKDSINGQFPHYTSKQKAQKLAGAIYELIERSLPNFSREVKKDVRNSIINRNLTVNSFTINSQDIFESILEIVTAEELQKQLPEWLQTKIDIEVESLEKYVSALIGNKAGAKEEIAAAIQLNYQEVNSNGQFFTESITVPAELNQTDKQEINKKFLTAALAAFFILVPIVYGVEKVYLANDEQKDVNVIENTAGTEVMPENALPDYLQYKQINQQALQVWLNKRNSILADEPYFTTIMEAANQHNLHPFLLFAITGQEQGFVPRSHQNAVKIANNPFNVFHSWNEYNTNILDSSQIAARTIVHLSEARPDNVDPIKWINRKYAEDPNWWIGVSTIFEKLEKEVQ